VAPDSDSTLSRKPREADIVALVQRHGFVSIDELARQFNVTRQTIRRDINQLCQQGRLRRYHGGAGLPSSVENVAYGTRRVLMQAEKAAIARICAAEIPHGASLFLNIGTTTEEVARALAHHSGLRVVTNNLNVATTLGERTDVEVILAGGVVRARDFGIVGEATIDMIGQFKLDFGIIGISGIDADGSLLDFDYREVRVAQAIIRNSRQVALVADHTKFGRSAMVRLGTVDQVDTVFTDATPPAPFADLLARNNVRVHIAQASAEGAAPDAPDAAVSR
jgi:DeoR family glycerol-3-phosphate regulon repressor